MRGPSLCYFPGLDLFALITLIVFDILCQGGFQPSEGTEMASPLMLCWFAQTSSLAHISEWTSRKFLNLYKYYQNVI